MPRHAHSPGAAFGNETESSILGTNASQKPAAAYLSRPETSPTRRRRYRGKHRKPSRIPVDPGLRAGATLSVLGAVLLPQLAPSEPSDANATALRDSSSDQRSARPDQAEQLPARARENPAPQQPEQPKALKRPTAQPSGSQQPRPEPRKEPEQTLADWADATSTIGVPARALQAYVKAERATRQDQPDCGIRWPLLAGIGKIESNHGRFGGAELADDGTPTKPIIGVALSGSSGVRSITDTDGGELDGDSMWDRAVGPMQFIPETWDKWAKDGTGDGHADPQSIDDAARTAANYLCGEGADLDSEEGQRDALMRYNNSTSYGNTVLSDAARFAKDSRPPPDVTPRSTRDARRS